MRFLVGSSPALRRAVGAFGLIALAACGGKVDDESPADRASASSADPSSPSQPSSPPARQGSIASPPETAEEGGAATFTQGVPPPFDWAGSCPSAAPNEFMAPPRPSNAELGDRLDAIRSGTVGRWYGNVTTPWIPAYSVYFEFDADGHYATRTTDPTMVALYYGTDLDTPLKQWRLDDVNQSGAASGTIDVAFDYETFFALPAWQGELHNVVLDASGNRLRFAFFTSSGYGPVEFDLWRCAP